MNEQLMKDKVSIIGLGYVGYTLSVLIAKSFDICGVDIDKKKVNDINSGKLLIKENYLKNYLKDNKINLKASTDLNESIKGSKFIIIATPTNFNEKTGEFDTSSVDQILSKVYHSKTEACIVIKSTLPIGYTEKKQKEYKEIEIINCPEFLRENNSFYDNLFPSRIVVGGNTKKSNQFANLIRDLAIGFTIENFIK